MNKIEIKKLNKECAMCNCCSETQGLLYEITFMKKTANGSSGMVIVLCKECIEDLVVEINNVYE